MKKFYLTLVTAMTALCGYAAIEKDITLVAFPEDPLHMENGLTIEVNNENAQLAQPGEYFFIAASVPYPSSETNYGILRFLDADGNDLPTLPELHLMVAGTKYHITRTNVEDVRKIAKVYGEKIVLQSISIRHDAIAGVTITPVNATIKPGETLDVKAAPIPGNVFVQLEWESSNEDVATVDENGLVTAVAEGEAEITAYAGVKYATCTLTVSNEINSVEAVIADGENADVYNTQGALVLKNADRNALRTLDKGIYIVNGKKIAVR